MQTLARVNRTFRGKEDGLLVAYAPLAENLAKALGEYTKDDRTNKPVGRNVEEAVTAALGLVEVLRGLLSGYDWKAGCTWPSSTPPTGRRPASLCLRRSSGCWVT